LQSALRLSPKIIAFSCEKAISVGRPFSQIPYFDASTKVLFASVVDNATVGYKISFQLTSNPPIMKA